MTHRVLDRLPQVDPKSLERYHVRALLAALPAAPRSYTWPCTTWLDQEREGACVGFSWAHELAARPTAVPQTRDDAERWYHRAQQLDGYPDDQEGSSVLAGAKAVQEAKLIGEYRWADGVPDLAAAIGRVGPAVLGIDWTEAMFKPDPDGTVHVTGDVAGGHAILCRGVNIKSRYFVLRNSWGRSWGRDGDCRVSWDDMEILLGSGGEACIPSGKHRPA